MAVSSQERMISLSKSLAAAESAVQTLLAVSERGTNFLAAVKDALAAIVVLSDMFQVNIYSPTFLDLI